MKIHGLQKMTLLDFPGRVACTVFLGGCDFRCPYCHNFELVTGEAKPIMDDQELFAFLEKRHGLLDGVAITGGEPCMNPGLPGLLRRIREMGFMTKLDTNGYHPDMLSSLLKEGLVDYVAMDIKNSPGKYAETAGLKELDMDRIRESIDLLRNGAVNYEFRTTVVKELHEEADFEEIGQMIRGAKRYFLQCFTDRDTVPFGNLHGPEPEEMERFAGIVRPYVPETQVRGM
ncbi:MAG: anaerobic ribonucleoside-triphosphate reductase activating protein [Lachnospiraceae bacterium]|nr:anaerobic ribonucleoside-triphosphate reductase activating protein [Lachnospiraceae bacterium]